MKIHEFDEDSKSLIISFASDTTQHQDPDQYRRLAYQPLTMFPDINDPAEALKRIAVSGLHQIQLQERDEQVQQNPLVVDQYRKLVGQTFSFLAGELIPPSPDADTIVEI